jgi:tRNA(adenine34) deaminase
VGEISAGPLTDDVLMGAALEEARLALEHGDVPVGVVVVQDGGIIARAHNERERRQDPCAHAEVLALQAAAARLGTWRLEGTTIVTTLEPCVMCAGALLSARVGRVVFGAEDPKAGAAGSLYNVFADPRLNHEIPLLARVRAEECGALLSEFFAGRRGSLA